MQAAFKNEESASVGRVVVMGLGNLLVSDDGVGSHVVKILLESKVLPDGIEIIDAGTASLDVLELFNENDKIIVIDAVRAGHPPGTLYKFNARDVRSKPAISMSLHQMSLLESLHMADLIGKAPKEVTIIGVEPEDMSYSTELSPGIKEKLPEIIRHVKECVQQYDLTT
ncbi:MAG: HyaD/HybD family hydrogenase maturation endopeptidase [Deltaproteobacteria bacterium]|nr:HyaD/HybD family hydrogenase maturation endopeptidase [Deltaproteobacteria bacterium]